MNLSGVRIEKTAVWQAGPDGTGPDLSFIPVRARRRLTDLERAALAVAHAVYPEPPPDEGWPVVFASRWGEIGQTFDLIRQFREEGEMSPAGFSASVHNAAPGAFSLFTHNTAPYTAIAAREATLAAGFLEALAMRSRVLFVYAEEATPSFYRTAFTAPQPACAVAVRLDATDWRYTGEVLPRTVSFAAFVAAVEAASAS